MLHLSAPDQGLPSVQDFGFPVEEQVAINFFEGDLPSIKKTKESILKASPIKGGPNMHDSGTALPVDRLSPSRKVAQPAFGDDEGEPAVFVGELPSIKKTKDSIARDSPTKPGPTMHAS